MVRAIIFTAILMSALAAKAQSPLFSGAQNNTQSVFRDPRQLTDTNYLRKKWFVTKYAGISTGFIVYKGGSSSFLSAPLELQVNRQLTNNVYAFGGIAVTPYLLQSNGVFYPTGIDKNYGLMRTSNYGINPAARVGVMYISNDKTFSISGSISVSRSIYNGYSPIYAPVNSHMQ
ncbi:hypothetical protein [Chitinophaga tropicalis]|uniref:Type IX secretion system membrane protein PorP/SprF n=1 Tax=Chitinophaga tropicalis TaxID=2683588 RepID=A0A7K1U1E4_9BACT|nr:hypothetical protein [Chitinophaga tropicalis]MVT07835.1 hypothetical protein [Chitinophaga tropicalis]